MFVQLPLRSGLSVLCTQEFPRWRQHTRECSAMLNTERIILLLLVLVAEGLSSFLVLPLNDTACVFEKQRNR